MQRPAKPFRWVRFPSSPPTSKKQPAFARAVFLRKLPRYGAPRQLQRERRWCTDDPSTIAGYPAPTARVTFGSSLAVDPVLGAMLLNVFRRFLG
jgi:hypothetical protein